MKRIFIALSLIFSSVLSIAQPVTLRIDPANATGGTASQIFDEVNYIPLETTKESLFGKIDQLAVTDKYFVILDDTNTNSILFLIKPENFMLKLMAAILTVIPANKFIVSI